MSRSLIKSNCHSLGAIYVVRTNIAYLPSSVAAVPPSGLRLKLVPLVSGSVYSHNAFGLVSDKSVSVSQRTR